MPFVAGRDAPLADGPTCRLGSYRARDGSSGAALHLDLDAPHAALVVGKRGYGKSYTLGVLAEGLARASGVAPVVVDPMGAFDGLARADGVEPAGESGGGSELSGGSMQSVAEPEQSVVGTVVEEPTVRANALPPRSWCPLLDLAPESGAGALVWQAARSASTLREMTAFVEGADAPAAQRRAAANHLALADDWNAFDADGLTAIDLAGPEATVLDVAGLDPAPRGAVVRTVAETLYRARVEGTVDRLPWLLVDEAHAFFDGVAEPALERILTRGRAPGVSLVLATQRPSVVPAVAVSQSDLLLAHRLTAERDLAALEAAQPTYLGASLAERLPSEPGEIVLVDDATETVHAAGVRQRVTPHGGESPRASEVSVRE